MPYNYNEEIAVSDVAFRAWGPTLEEMFRAAADATMNAMVGDLSSIAPRVQCAFELRHESLDLLLLNFLQELIYYKDAQRLLLRVAQVSFTREKTEFLLQARAEGEPLDAERHELVADVKGVTLHRLQVAKSQDGWEATVTLDI